MIPRCAHLLFATLLAVTCSGWGENAVTVSFDWDHNPAKRNERSLLWLCSSPEGRALLQSLSSAQYPAAEEAVGTFASGLAATAVQASRRSALWLDDAYRLEWPNLVETGTLHNASAWEAWLRSVTLQPAFVSVFTAQLDGELFQADFSQPTLVQAGVHAWLEGAGSPDPEAPPIDEDTRTIVATTQRAEWTVAPALGAPDRVVDWFFPSEIETGVPQATYDVWVGRLPAAIDTWGRRSVEIPLGNAGTLVLRDGTDSMGGTVGLQALRAAPQPLMIELRIPEFSVQSTAVNRHGNETLDAYGYTGLIDRDGTRLQTTRTTNLLSLAEGRMTLEATALITLSLTPPDPPPGGGSIGVVISYPYAPDVEWVAPALDFSFNEPFSWWWISDDGIILAKGSTESVGTPTTEHPDGWHQSHWFGKMWTKPTYSRFWVVDANSEANGWHWIFHENQGWLYLHTVAARGFWAWDNGMQEWAWTNAQLYPWIYFAQGGWAYYLSSGAEGRTFYFAQDGAFRTAP